MCMLYCLYELKCESKSCVYCMYALTQYPSSTRPIIKLLAIAMASYERWYRAEKDNPLRQLLHSLWKGNKYLQNPTQMGLKLDELTLMSSVYFVKAFWSIMEQDAVKVCVCMTIGRPNKKGQEARFQCFGMYVSCLVCIVCDVCVWFLRLLLI